MSRESTIQNLYSGVTGSQPTPTDLEYGEIAINTVDAKIYFRGSDDSLNTVHSGDVVSSVNGATGDVTTPRYYTMNMRLGSDGSTVIPTGMVAHSLQHVSESLELVDCQLYVPSGIVNALNNFVVSVKKTTTLSDSTANINSGATSVATVSVFGGGKAGANYYNTATLSVPGPTSDSGEWIFCDVTNNTDSEVEAIVMLKWQIT